MSAYPSLHGLATISFVHNKFADTYISNCEPIAESNSLEIKVLYVGDSSNIPDHIADSLLTVVNNIDKSKRPFRWYQFTSQAAEVNNKKEIKQVRTDSIRMLLSKIGTPENVWIFEVHYKDNIYYENDHC